MAVTRPLRTRETTMTAVPRQPRLLWNGRESRREAEPVPAQVLEIVRPQRERVVSGNLGTAQLLAPAAQAPQNRLIWTNDNLVALTSLRDGDDEHEPLAGQVDLIYIDPPFAVQSNFNISVEIEEGVTDEKLPSLIEELAYRDTWADGLDSYLSMMRDRLELLKALLRPTGSIYVHCDWHAGHYLKVLMDEVFGYENFRNEITWRRDAAGKGAKRISSQWPRNSDSILLYSMNPDTLAFHQQYTGLTDEQRKAYRLVDPDGRRFKAVQLGDYSAASIDKMRSEGLIYVSSTGAEYKKYYLDEAASTLDSIWIDVPGFGVRTAATENVKFPTQKPEALLQRIIAASSNPGDLVLDAFCGSGTTAVAAETMTDPDGKPAPRRWIAIDCGKFAVHITRKRLIEAQASAFTVENIGYYARADSWQSLAARHPSARMYRNALVEIYGGEPVEGFTFLHDRKGGHWVHVGPLDAPIVESQLAPILQEAADTTLRAVDILSADIPVDWNPNAVEYQYGVKVYPKIIPQAAVEAVRERIKRRRRQDPSVEPAPEIHFFSPPDVEVGFVVQPGSVTITLLRLTVDLDDCLSTQDEEKRARIKAAIKDWSALVDYWAIDWDWQEGKPFENQWQSFRTKKQRELSHSTSHIYPDRGEKRIAVKVTDIFGNDGLKVVRVTV